MQLGNHVRIKVHLDLSPARVKLDVISFSISFMPPSGYKLNACCCIMCCSDVSVSAGVVDLDGADSKHFNQ